MKGFCRLCLAEDHRESSCVSCARDPHHDGFSIWRWDGSKLWIRTETTRKWTEVKKLHPTPKRIAVLNSLMQRQVRPWFDELI